MKITQAHLRHHTYIELVTVGEGKDKKQFNLQTISEGVRVHAGRYSHRRGAHLLSRCSGGSFDVTKTHDFDSREAALAFCEAA